MAATNIYTYGGDILQDALFRAGESTNLTGTTSDYLTPAKRYLWRSYINYLMEYPWSWAVQDPPGVITTLDEQTDTAIINHDATTVTFTTGDGGTTWANRKFMFDNSRVVYRLSSRTSATVYELDATFKEDSVTSAAACTVFQDEYSLASDCMKPWFFYDRNNPDHEIAMENRRHLGRHHTSRTVTGSTPSRVGMIAAQKVRLVPYPTSAITVEYEYTPLPSELDYGQAASTDIPVVPAEDRHILADMVAAQILIDKDEPRGTMLMQSAMAAMRERKGWVESMTRFKLTPRPGRSLGSRRCR